MHIWDAVHCKFIWTMGDHRTKVGTLAWNSHILSYGSRDRNILQREIWVQYEFVSKFSSHNLEVNLLGFLLLVCWLICDFITTILSFSSLLIDIMCLYAFLNMKFIFSRVLLSNVITILHWWVQVCGLKWSYDNYNNNALVGSGLWSEVVLWQSGTCIWWQW